MSALRLPLSPTGRGCAARAARVRGKSIERQRGAQRFQHTGEIVQHIVVPESHDAVARSLEKLSSPLIVRLGRLGSVRMTIQLNDQFAMVAGEVCKIGPDRHLAPEMHLRKSLEKFPYDTLGRRSLVPKFPCSNGVFGCASIGELPSWHPSPLRGGVGGGG